MSPIASATFCGFLALAAASDLRSRRIPNLLCVALALAALVLAWPVSQAEWLSRAGSALTVGSAALALYLVRGMGGGDVKLLAAVALWIPMGGLPLFVTALAAAGTAQALAVLAVRRRETAVAGAAPAAHADMPYAVSVAVAGLAWALSMPTLQTLVG